MKKIMNIILFILSVIIFTGCSYTDDATEIYQKGPFDSIIDKTKVSVAQTVYISHKDGFVTQAVFSEEYTLIDGDYKDLERFARSVDDTFLKDFSNIQGLKYTSELTSDCFSNKITCDYTKIDHASMSDEVIVFCFGADYTDNQYNLLFDEYIKKFSENGFILQE